MQTSLRLFPAISVIFFLTTVGCIDVRPQYVEPGAAAEIAVLAGKDGTYINEVDGARVASGEVINSDRGNQVRVAAGRHFIKAAATGSTGSGVFAFYFDCEADHKYEIHPESDKSLNLVVHDVKTDKTVFIN